MGGTYMDDGYLRRVNTFRKLGDDELEHYGVLGMKWGVRRYQPYPKGSGRKGIFKGKKKEPTKKKPSDYKARGIKAKIAQRKNVKVDKEFKKWKAQDEQKAKAIDVGKKRNLAKIASDKDPGNKSKKDTYKDLNKQYKKERKKTTVHREGDIRNKVGMDLSRKYLSEAKKVEKKMQKSPGDRKLAKEHATLMGEYNKARASARKATIVGQKRSQRKANLKRSRTMAVKAIATTTVVAIGTNVVNDYLKSKGQTGLNSEAVTNAMKFGRDFLKGAGYLW